MYKKIVRMGSSPLILAVALLMAIFAITGVKLASQDKPTRYSAGVNETINYQARLLNLSGAVVPDGAYNVQFKIYCGGDGVIGSVTDADCTNSTQEDLL